MKKEIVAAAKKLNQFLHRYINGAKGAVTLLLALVVSPMLSVALLLVESARYQNAVELMEELMDSSAFSTISEYEPYLEERFGLLAVSQEKQPQELFNSYLTDNVKSLGKSITVRFQSAVGEFPLSDTDMLKHQLLEASELTVSTKTIAEGINLKDMKDDLMKALKLDDILDKVEAVKDAYDIAKEVTELVKALEELQKIYNDKYVKAKNAYRDAYGTFEDKGVALAEKLADAEKKLKKDEPYNTIYSNSKVQSSKDSFFNARDTYVTKARGVITELENIRTQTEKCFTALEKATKAMADMDKHTSDGSAMDLCTTSTTEWVITILGGVSKFLNKTLGTDKSNGINADIAALNGQINELNSIVLETVKPDWTSSDFSSSYGILIQTSVDNMGDKIQELCSQLNEDSKPTDEQSKGLGDMLDTLHMIMGLPGIYDVSLNAKLDPTVLHTSSDPSASTQLLMVSIQTMIQAADDFGDSFTSFDFIKALKAVVEFLGSLVEFLTAIVAWAVTLVQNFVAYFDRGWAELYNYFLLTGYAVYNLPNRTNFNTGSTLTGADYKDIFNLAGGTINGSSLPACFEEFGSLSDVTGTDRMFKGAETEYMLVGAKSEIMNQEIAFFNLYLFRLIADLRPILTNASVKAEALTLAGPASWVVTVAVILVEPLLDTLILCNSDKAEQFLLKDTIYMTPQGVYLLLDDMREILDLHSNVKDKLKETLLNHTGDPASIKKGLFKMTYQEHMLILMMLFVTPSQYMQRMQNIIQMETAEKYRHDYTFDLDKAYTYLNTTVDYTLQPMFRLDGLTDRGLFSVACSQHTGY